MEVDIRTDVLSKLNKVKENGNGWVACCPAHQDENPSLAIAEDSGKILLHCFKGCKFDDILRALDLYEPKQKIKGFNQNGSKQPKALIDTYDYTDENGKLLYQIVRFEDKKFGIRRPDGRNGWIWNANEVKKTLYRLPEIKKARENNELIIFCEGEKDVQNVKVKLNLTATTSPLGANSWKEDYANSLAGLDVVVLPDNDEAGRKYAETVANSIFNKAQSVKVVNLPNLLEKEDVSDWIEKGGDREQFLELISRADDWRLKDMELIKVGNGLIQNVIDGTCDDYLMTAPLTDTGNAECFLKEYGDKFVFNKTNQEWYQWNGVIWNEDKINAVDDAILKVIRNRQNVTLEMSNSDTTTKVRNINYMIRCEDVVKRKNIKQAVELLPKFITTIERYDKDLLLVATQNGTLDLRNVSFRDSRQEDFLTLQLGSEHNADADCPRWERFLREIFNNDEEMIDFIQRIAGYSLTGAISEQAVFILYGFGKNGKTVFLNTLGALLGDYAGTASFKTFDADKQNEQSNDLAMLKGKRFVSMSESAADRRLNEPLIKQVTGGDKITCRFLRKEFFSYTPQFKLFLATNHKPVITQSDFGIWRRIVLITFEQNFDGREESGLEEQLISELPGILNWAIEGLKKWNSEGLKNRPQAVIEATNKYRQDSDTVGQWLECNMTQHPNSEIKSSEAYNDYRNWAVENGHYPLGNKTFKSSLEERGFYINKTNKANFWRGFGFPFDLK